MQRLLYTRETLKTGAQLSWALYCTGPYVTQDKTAKHTSGPLLAFTSHIIFISLPQRSDIFTI